MCRGKRRVLRYGYGKRLGYARGGRQRALVARGRHLGPITNTPSTTGFTSYFLSFIVVEHIRMGRTYSPLKNLHYSLKNRLVEQKPKTGSSKQWQSIASITSDCIYHIVSCHFRVSLPCYSRTVDQCRLSSMISVEITYSSRKPQRRIILVIWHEKRIQCCW